MEKYKIEYKFINLFLRDIGYCSCTVFGFFFFFFFGPPLYLFIYLFPFFSNLPFKILCLVVVSN